MTSGRLKKTNVMPGSERMLKAHHKNAVFLKNLEVKKTLFDEKCNKRLSKYQQQIYDIYFNEYIPLKQQAKEIKDRLPTVPANQKENRWTKLATIPGSRRATGVKLPEIYTLSLVSSSVKREKQDNVDTIIDSLREKEKVNCDNIKESHNCTGKANCVIWPDSESDDMDEIDEDRLRILKAAVALTSQPALPLEPQKPSVLRKSYLAHLRRQSKLDWENELMRRAGAKASDENANQDSLKPDDAFETENLIWRPSLTRNRILNSFTDSDISGTSELNFADHESHASRASLTSTQSDFLLSQSEDEYYSTVSSVYEHSLVGDHSEKNSLWSTESESDNDFT